MCYRESKCTTWLRERESLLLVVTVVSEYFCWCSVFVILAIALCYEFAELPCVVEHVWPYWGQPYWATTQTVTHLESCHGADVKSSLTWNDLPCDIRDSALLAFLCINLKVIFLALPYCLVMCHPLAYEWHFMLHMAHYSFFIVLWMLQFTIFKVIVVKWLSKRPIFPNTSLFLGLAFGYPWGYHHQNMSLCKISAISFQQFRRMCIPNECTHVNSREQIQYSPLEWGR